MTDPRGFFSAILGAGSILAGFCGTFLSFRIQREASYYEQPVLDFVEARAKNVSIKMTHFTSALLLLCFGTLGAATFGVLFPVFALADLSWFLHRPDVAGAGLIASMVLVAGYFVSELAHYEVLPWKWGNTHEKALAKIVCGLAASAYVFGWWLLRL